LARKKTNTTTAATAAAAAETAATEESATPGTSVSVEDRLSSVECEVSRFSARVQQLDTLLGQVQSRIDQLGESTAVAATPRTVASDTQARIDAVEQELTRLREQHQRGKSSGVGADYDGSARIARTLEELLGAMAGLRGLREAQEAACRETREVREAVAAALRRVEEAEARIAAQTASLADVAQSLRAELSAANPAAMAAPRRSPAAAAGGEGSLATRVACVERSVAELSERRSRVLPSSIAATTAPLSAATATEVSALRAKIVCVYILSQCWLFGRRLHRTSLPS